MQTNRKIEYLIYLVSSTLSTFGTSITTLAIVLISTGSDSDSWLLSSNMLVRTIPAIILAPIAGYLIRSLNKKLLTLFSEIAKGVLIFILFIFPIPNLTIPISFFITIMEMFSSLAKIAWEYSIFEKDLYLKKKSIQRISFKGAKIAAPIFASLLISVSGIKFLFLFDSFTYFISAISFLFISFKPEDSNVKKKMNFFDAISSIKKVSSSIEILFFFILSILGSVTYITCINYIRYDLKIDDSSYALLTSVSTIGTILSAFLLVILPRSIKSHSIYIVACISFGLAKPFYSLSGWLYYLMFINLLNAFNSGLIDTLFGSIVLETSKEEDRTLAISCAGAAQNAGNSIGYIIYPIINLLFDNRKILFIFGILIIGLLTRQHNILHRSIVYCRISEVLPDS